jgi:hypothetical protein
LKLVFWNWIYPCIYSLHIRVDIVCVDFVLNIIWMALDVKRGWDILEVLVMEKEDDTT